MFSKEKQLKLSCSFGDSSQYSAFFCIYSQFSARLSLPGKFSLPKPSSSFLIIEARCLPHHTPSPRPFLPLAPPLVFLSKRSLKKSALLSPASGCNTPPPTPPPHTHTHRCGCRDCSTVFISFAVLSIPKQGPERIKQHVLPPRVTSVRRNNRRTKLKSSSKTPESSAKRTILLVLLYALIVTWLSYCNILTQSCPNCENTDIYNESLFSHCCWQDAYISQC